MLSMLFINFFDYVLIDKGLLHNYNEYNKINTFL